MFERPRSGERAILVHLALTRKAATNHDLAEFEELAAAAGASTQAVVSGSRQVPEPRYFVGSGKAAEIRELAEANDAELVIFNHELSPSQERNLESLMQRRVLDRTGLILDIFAQRARSFEGKLQVELAQLQHLSTRLVRGWTHLERQRGGIGLRGPGETQLETDRRLLNDRIKQINQRLAKVDRQRSQGRSARHKAETASVSLVGYTNAGKSTLFNRLTDAHVYAADQLFATLDPTLRRLELPNADAVVLADTVGFISNLPHELVAAFSATLQETREADLLIHVIDASNPERALYAAEVEQVLAQIGADTIPCLRVYNKIDCLEQTARLERDPNTGEIQSVWLSALRHQGLDLLRTALAERLRGDSIHTCLRLPASQGRLRARLFRMRAVLKEQLNSEGEWLLEVQTSRANFDRLRATDELREEWLEPST